MAIALIVAEKPSIAAAIATALSSGGVRKKEKRIPVHEFPGSFQGQSVTFRVTAVTGHVYSTDFPKQYQDWDRVDPLDLFSAPVNREENRGNVVRHLQEEAHGADYLILFLDCDREGENICFEVIHAVQGKLKNGRRAAAALQEGRPLTGRAQNIFRAKFSAIAKSDIQQAMRTLTHPNVHESWSVEARQELDLKIGVAFSRFQTRYFQGRYGDLDSSLVSYGPCQTPTLGFCVARHDEIQTFEPETFWTLDLEITAGSRAVPLEWSRGRVFDQTVARLFETLVSEDAVVRVTKVESKEVTRSRPTPLNTVELLKLASKTLSMGPAQTMMVAERLYLQGFLSYPRTESTQYPGSFDLRGTVASHTRHSVWGDYAQSLLHGDLTRPKKGVDAGDHPPITPIRVPTGGELSGDMARVYDLVARHFLATVSPDAKLLSTKAEFESGGEAFSVSGRQIISPGFLQISGGSIEDHILPSFSRGDEVRLGKAFDDVGTCVSFCDQHCLGSGLCWVARFSQFVPSRLRVREGKTSPPGHLTESELIAQMEKHGIGTDASIPSHINNIVQRNYVELGPNRTLIPTNLGIVLVRGYHKIDSDLVLPRVRASIEGDCDRIARGVASPQAVVRHATTVFAAKFRYFVAHVALMDALFEATFSPLTASGKPISRCGKCRRYMSLITSKPQRLHCATCNETYSLPQDGLVKLFHEKRCPLDNFELLMFCLGKSPKALGKNFTLCPYCYNNPPFEEVGQKMGCNECLHPSCPQSLVQNAVCPCPAGIATDLAPQEDRGRGRGGGRGRSRSREARAGAGGDDRGDRSSRGEPARCRGIMVLDTTAKPVWKMDCNRCSLIIRFHGEIRQLAPDPETKCEQCGSNMLHVTFRPGHSPLADGEEEVFSCVLCNETLNEMTEMRHGRTKHAKVVQQRRAKARESRGRGRGRGGRGRGRGRGSKNPLLSFEDF